MTPGKQPETFISQVADVCADVPVSRRESGGLVHGTPCYPEKTGRSIKEIGEEAPMMKVWGRNPGNGLLVDEAIAATPRSTTRKD